MVLDGADTLKLVDPDFEGSCAEVAVTVAVPALVAEKTPPAVMVPPVADQLTAVL